MEISDKFQDFFNRLKAETEAHLISGSELLCGSCELETINMFLDAFGKSIIIPRGHGRLIDESDLIPDSDYEDGMFYAVSIGAINGAPTIIGSDQEVEQVSVILTGMNMPDDCKECDLCTTDACNGIDWNTKSIDFSIIPKNCPLKSVNGLIEKMQGEIAKLRDYNAKLNQESDYYSTPEIQNVSGNIKGLLKAIAIIKEYCGMED